KTHLQTALDAGLIAGAKDGSTSWTLLASNVFSANLKTTGGTAGTPTFTKDSDAVFKGVVTGSMPTSILGIVKISAIPVKATATATAADSDNSCILTLDHGQPKSHVSLTLNGAPVINLSGCSIRSNTSMNCNGHDGNVTKSFASGAAVGCGHPKSNTSVVPDIYKDLAKNITQICNGARPGVTWTPGTLPTGAGIKTITNAAGYTEHHI